MFYARITDCGPGSQEIVKTIIRGQEHKRKTHTANPPVKPKLPDAQRKRSGPAKSINSDIETEELNPDGMPVMDVVDSPCVIIPRRWRERT